jgi:RNA polymerase sigma factor (sigma-70 family)
MSTEEHRVTRQCLFASNAAVLALSGRLRRFVRRRVASREDAEDVIQEAYFRLLRYLADHEVENEEHLLVTAARNLAADSLRRRRTRYQTAIDYAVITATEQNCLTPEDELDIQQRLHHVADALALLPPRCREVFLLHRVDNLTYSQIAEHCGISVSTVEKHIARACLLMDARINGEARRP